MDFLVLIDELDDLIYNAKPVPLTDTFTLIDRLEEVVHGAPQVPLVGQLRVDKETVYGLLDQMRAAVAEEIRHARGAAAPSAGAAEASSAEPVSVEAAARSLPQLVHRVKFGGESFRIELNGVPMAELRPPE